MALAVPLLAATVRWLSSSQACMAAKAGWACCSRNARRSAVARPEACCSTAYSWAIRRSASSARGRPLVACTSKNLRRLWARQARSVGPAVNKALYPSVIVDRQMATPVLQERARVGASKTGVVSRTRRRRDLCRARWIGRPTGNYVWLSRYQDRAGAREFCRHAGKVVRATVLRAGWLATAGPRRCDQSTRPVLNGPAARPGALQSVRSGTAASG